MELPQKSTMSDVRNTHYGEDPSRVIASTSHTNHFAPENLDGTTICYETPNGLLWNAAGFAVSLSFISTQGKTSWPVA